jgi:diketogulonate reductase-like aldo/keto reductase
VLDLEYVDLLLIHWPCDKFEDTLATYKALEPYVTSGKARAIGVSNFNAALIEQLVPAGEEEGERERLPHTVLEYTLFI